MTRPIAALLPVLLALASCSAPPPPVTLGSMSGPSGPSRSDAATRAACREHADEVFDRQHRDTIYTINNRDTPFSANFSPGVTDRGLPQRYARENMIRDCVRNTGTETDRTQPEPSAAGAPPAPPAPKP